MPKLKGTEFVLLEFRMTTTTAAAAVIGVVVNQTFLLLVILGLFVCLCMHVSSYDIAVFISLSS